MSAGRNGLVFGFRLCQQVLGEFAENRTHLLKVGLVKAKTQVEATEQALQAGSYHEIRHRHLVVTSVFRLVAALRFEDQAKVIEAATGEVDAFSEAC